MGVPDFDAKPPAADGDDLMFVPFRWRRLYRYLFGVAWLAGLALFASWMLSEGTERQQTLLAWAIGLFALYGLAVMWELMVGMLVLAAVLLAWHFAKDFAPSTWIFIGWFLSLMGFGYYVDLVRNDMQAKVDHLQRQINQLRNPGW